MFESSLAWIQTTLDQFLAGDPSAKVSLVHDTEQRLKKVMPRFFPQGDQHPEVTSNLIAAAFEKFNTSLGVVRPHTPRQFLRLAYLQMKRVLLDLVRATSPDQARQSVSESAPHSPTSVAELLEAVETLDDKLKEVVIMVYFHGLTESEAAKVLGQAPEALKLHWSRAQAVLGARLPALRAE